MLQLLHSALDTSTGHPQAEVAGKWSASMSDDGKTVAMESFWPPACLAMQARHCQPNTFNMCCSKLRSLQAPSYNHIGYHTWKTIKGLPTISMSSLNHDSGIKGQAADNCQHQMDLVVALGGHTPGGSTCSMLKIKRS